MEILCYLLGGLSVLFGLATAILYHKMRPKDAFISKMMASTLFIASGITALACTSLYEVGAMLVVIAMLLSFWGDYFLARKEVSKIESRDNFALGVMSFSLAQVVFSVGFLMLNNNEFNYYLIPLLFLGVLMVVVGKVTHMFSFGKGEMILSMIYGVLLSLTLVINISGYMDNPDSGTLCAMLGSIFFVVSDGALGLYLFTDIKKKVLFNYPVMLFYYAAEILYAISLII